MSGNAPFFSRASPRYVPRSSCRYTHHFLFLFSKCLGQIAKPRFLAFVTFYYNEEYSSNPERIHNGFIAQDYAKVLPAATYYDDSLDRLCIDTGELIALLVRAVQQLESRVTRMEAKNVLEKV